MAQKINIPRWLKLSFKFFIWTGVSLIFLVGIIWLLLQTSAVQNFATQKVLSMASEKTNHVINIDNVRISWFDQIEVDDFLLMDYAGDTLTNAKTIWVNYDLSKLISEEVMEVEEIHIESGGMNMTKHSDSTELNLSVFLKSLNEITKSDTVNNKPMILDRVILEDFSFRMTDESKEENIKRIDFSHLRLDISLAEITTIKVQKDSIAFEVSQFVATDHAKRMSIENLEMKVGYTDKFLVLDDLVLETEHSLIGDSIRLDYNHPSAMSSFADSVDLYMNVTKSQIHSNDAKAFTGSTVLKNSVNLSFEMIGKISDLRIRNFKAIQGHSFIDSDISLIGLPTLEETFMDVSISDMHLYSNEMSSYISDREELFDKLEYLDVKAVFSGFIKNFSTKASISTALGEMKADMNVTIPEDKTQTSYTGHLEMKGLDLGPLVGDTTLLQRVSMKGRVLGKGTTRETATLLVDLTAKDIGVKNYSYDSLSFKGYLAAKHFYGHFGIDDPNCKISGITNMDLRKAPEKLSLNTTIDTLFTKRLNLTEEDFFLQAKINWKQTHLELDSLVGSLKLSDIIFNRDSTRTLRLESAHIETSLDSIERKVTLDMPGISADLSGDFTFKNLFQFLEREATDLSSYFDLKSDSVSYEDEPLLANLQADLLDINPYLEFFSPNIFVSNRSNVEMTFEKKENSDAIVSLYARADSILFNEDAFLQNEVDMYASLDSNSDGVLGSFLFSSKEQHWQSIPHSERFVTEGVWDNDKIEVTTVIHQPETNTKSRINSEVTLLGDTIEFKFLPSEISALGNRWGFDPTNHIHITKSGISIESLDIKSDNKLASLSGLLSDSLHSRVNLVTRNIDLSQLNSVLGIPIEGSFDANFTVHQPAGEPVQFEGNFNLHDFIYKDLLIGNINATSYWDEEKEGVRARVSVDRENFRTIDVDGYYYPLRKERFDFDISFDQADFKMLEVFTEENLSNVKGAASGKVNFSGTAEKPVLTGTCEIEEGGFKVNYLQTTYDFGGKILLEEGEIDFKDFVLRDADGDSATFDGDIRHTYFTDITADLHVAADKFNFLNTTSSDNSLYYGSAIASGDIFITGALNDLVIKVNAKTEKGTRFFIPLSDSEDYEQAEFISFIDLSDTTRSVEDVINVVKQSLGLTIDFDLEVTPDAYVELIFDIKTGDIIRGRGNGNLKLKLDKNGNFELYGPLTITEGAYNFTVPNFINKEFEVVPGGTIVWYGDPYSGSMELTATYMQKASFGSLLSDPNAQQDGAMSKKYPVIVVLELKGDILAPNIEFDIALDESVSFAQNTEVTKLITQIKGDEQQLKRQVVSLLFFKRFSPLQSSFVGGGGSSGGSIGKSLSEFLTNQISYLATQLDENLEVEVDLTNLDQEGFNTFQLRLAYTFMDGRLKVTRGGDFTSATSENQNAVNDIIGDWSVEYMLTKDGKLRAKMFSQTNQSLLTNQSQQNMETGLSLRFIKSFNTFKDILTKTRSEAIQRKEDEDHESGKSGTE